MTTPTPVPDKHRVLLEERLAFCERLNETLNEVVCDLQARLSRMEFRFESMRREIQRLQNAPRDAAPRTLEEERPPHY